MRPPRWPPRWPARWLLKETWNIAMWPPREPVPLQITISQITKAHCHHSLQPWQESHMGIQILHSTEGMVMGFTPLHPAEERPPFIRILATGSSMFSHGLLDPKPFCTIWTDEDLIWPRLFRTVSDSCMLSQSLLHHILPTTLLTSELEPLDAAFLVIP